ncbi:MAG: hypothetical protein ACJ8AO_21445 [Gemmatimonadaceae bacterium]
MTDKKRRCSPARLVAAAVALGAASQQAGAQAEVMAWGNVEGLRVQGQVVPFESSICVLGPDGAEIARTAKERQRPTFAREGARRTVTTRLRGLAIREVVEDRGPGVATIELTVTADSAPASAAAHLCVDVPRAAWAGGDVALQGDDGTRATGALVTAPGRRVSVSLGAPAEALVREGERRSVDHGRVDFVRVAFAVLPAGAPAGTSARLTATLRASGAIDRRPITVAIDQSSPGPAFDGIGGNFRIQNARLDPPVIAYNLANMRVSWGRVELPWRSWHPEEGADPAAVPPERLDARVRAAMEMARTLSQRGVPVTLAVWFPPQWAVVGALPGSGEPPPGTPRGNPLDPAKLPRIYESIASYIRYLKEHYGVEPALFSFNEADLGIDVRQTAEEHRDFIKGLGAYLAAQGIATKLLLGDTADATGTAFILPALEDPAARPFIGAVSFHSWRGWSDSLLGFWDGAARRLGVPLLVGEGSTDAGAWRYPAIFREATFAREEVALYVRMLARARPLSILQWQLTSDYSVLAGGGLAGDTTALRPTQRFWNLKQLASSPAGARHLPASCGHPLVWCAAVGAPAGAVAVHLVNDGAARAATITGLPAGVRSLRRWVTDERRGMTELARVPVRGGVARVTLDAASFTTLSGAP